MKYVLFSIGFLFAVYSRSVSSSTSTSSYTSEQIKESFKVFLEENKQLTIEFNYGIHEIDKTIIKKLLSIDYIKEIKKEMDSQIKAGTANDTCVTSISRRFLKLYIGLRDEEFENVLKDPKYFEKAFKDLEEIDNILTESADVEEKVCLKDDKNCKIPEIIEKQEELYKFSLKKVQIITRIKSSTYLETQEAQKVLTKILRKGKKCGYILKSATTEEPILPYTSRTEE